MAVTAIQWTQRRILLPHREMLLIKGYTFNPWWGCLKVSEECAHCYALDIAHHYRKEALWGPAATTPRRIFGEKHWQEPFTWNRQAEKQGHRRSVFCASMADVFEPHPMLDNERMKLWALIEKTPWLNWLLLTKRPEQVLKQVPWPVSSSWPDNIWVGTSVGLQQRAEERIPYLLEIPAVVRFLSCEPLLGPLDLTPWLPSLQWVISGGESGSDARPMDMAWPRSLRDQCQAAGIPYFFKQVGGRYHNSGGRLLDGQTWDEIPPEAPAKCTAECLIEESFSRR
jgi:protein gp37